MAEALLAQLSGDDVLRVHAYEAARRLHAGVARHSGSPGASGRAVAELVGGHRVVMLDELHAHEPGDAVLLARVVRAVTDAGAVLLATSNYPPSGLLPDPRFHHVVLPLVDAVEAHCDVVALEGGPDHRALGHGGARPGFSSGAWLRPGSPAQLVGAGLVAPQPGDRTRTRIGSRDLWVAAVTGTDVHVGWDELCAGPTSVGDLADLVTRYRTVVLGGAPHRCRSTPDARRRFTDLVDVAWDTDTRLVVLTRHPPDDVLDPATPDHDRHASRVGLLRHQ